MVLRFITSLTILMRPKVSIWRPIAECNADVYIYWCGTCVFSFMWVSALYWQKLNDVNMKFITITHKKHAYTCLIRAKK